MEVNNQDNHSAYLNLINAHVNARVDMTDDPNTDEETLWALVKDPSCDVRFALAENHNIDSDILATLTHDENPYVAWRAQKTIKRISVAAVVTGNFNWQETHQVKRRADMA